MKIGDLASILNKDASELAKAYNLAETEDGLNVDTLKNVFQSEVQSVEKSALKRGKDDGYGMAERLVKTEVEKRLKSEFGIDGANLDDLVTGISGIINQQKTVVKKSDDAELQREIELRKKVEADFESFKTSVDTEKKRASQFALFDSHFSSKFDVATNWIKDSAFNRFAERFEIMKGNESVFAIEKATNKPISDNIDDLITSFFKADFEAKGEKKEIPKNPNVSEMPNITGNKEDLFAQLRAEKDPTRRDAILKKIKEL